MLSRTTPAADRWYVAGIAGVTLIGAALTLTYVPTRFLDFAPRPATGAASQALVHLLSQRIPGLVRSATACAMLSTACTPLCTEPVKTEFMLTVAAV